MVELYATPTALERYTEIAETAVDAGVDVEFVTEEVLDAMADTVTPQGFVAVCRQFPTAVKDVFAAKPKLVAILEEVRDPGNAGTIVRAADAAGADAVVFTGPRGRPLQPEGRPQLDRLDLPPPRRRRRRARRTCSSAPAAAGLTVLAADVKGEDLLTARNDGVLARPTAWLFGNEAHGLPDEQLALADRVVTVPIYGHAESMNLATAASVCLYESAFAQRSAHHE